MTPTHPEKHPHRLLIVLGLTVACWAVVGAGVTILRSFFA